MTTYLLNQKIKEESGYGQTLYDTVEHKAEEVKQKQKDDDKQYDTALKIKLVCEGIHVKEIMATGKLNNANARMIMANLTTH